jgi:hypothetical protein
MPYKDKAERNKSLKTWRKRAEEEGFCNLCTKNKVSDGYKVCETCRIQALERYKKRKKRASENKQCVDCKTSITNDGLRCRTCSKKHSLIGVNKRQKARADKKCTMCFTETVEKNTMMISKGKEKTLWKRVFARRVLNGLDTGLRNATTKHASTVSSTKR